MKRRDRNIIGENIRRLRMQTGLTQEELALKSGLSQGYVNQLENGKRKYTQKSLELIADALAIPVAEMFKEEGEQRDVVSEKVVAYKRKRPDKKEFLVLLNELPDHIVEHYLTLLKLEKKIQNGKL
ncbi:MAG: helix-turn-helix transcriptional regulator [Nitrospirae bacterium]|nr:helix-turn-helix transcriptional regulator [Nitrospirota bacterium]